MTAESMRKIINILNENTIDYSQLQNGNAPGYTYYHGTPESSYEYIKIHGLDPAHSKWEDDEISNNDTGYQGSFKFVYLSLSPSTAESFASSQYNKYHTNFVVLKVTPTPDIEKQFVYNISEYVRCPVLIPPDRISLYKVIS